MKKRRYALTGAASGALFAMVTESLITFAVPRDWVVTVWNVFHVPSKMLFLPVAAACNLWLRPCDVPLLSIIAWTIIGLVYGLISYRMSAGIQVSRNRWRIFRIIAQSVVFAAVTAFVLAIMWIVLGILPFLGAANGRTALMSMVSPGIQEVSELTSIRFPRSTKLLYSASGSWQGNYDVEAKAIISQSDVDGFVKALGGCSRLSDGSDLGVDADDMPNVPWWNVKLSQKVVVVDSYPPGKGRLQVWIALDNPGRAVLYVYWVKLHDD